MSSEPAPRSLKPTSRCSFTATATGSITGVTKLPGGLTQINFTGSGGATHLGSVTDSIFLSISGRFEGKSGGDKCVVTSTGTYTVTGGAGAFAKATGSGTLSTQFDLCAGTASGTYTGTISQPNSN